MSKHLPWFCWHLHHDVLIEWCYDHQNRFDFIRNEKKPSEQALRIRLFQPVRGSLPPEVVNAGTAYGNTREARNSAERALNLKSAERARHDEWKALEETQGACIIAWEALHTAVRDNLLAINALHAVECTNCSWDGHTIFPRAEEARQ